jgi:hypothetical protein
MASRRPSRLIFPAAAALFAIFALAAGVLAGAAYAIPIALLALIVLGFLGLNALLARRTMQRHDGDARAAQDDGADGVPSAHLISDDDRPLGDTAQAHDEISPHDLPKDSPGRRAAEAQAARRNGTTRGHARGGAGGAVLAPADEHRRDDADDA